MALETSEKRGKGIWVTLLGVGLAVWPLMPLYSGYVHVRGGKYVFEWVFAFQQQGLNLPDPMWEIYLYVACIFLGIILIVFGRRME